MKTLSERKAELEKQLAAVTVKLTESQNFVQQSSILQLKLQGAIEYLGQIEADENAARVAEKAAVEDTKVVEPTTAVTE